MNKKTKIILGIVVLVAVVLIVVLYKPAEKGTIKIGFSAPLTGDASAWGLPVKRGAEIALDRINSKGGINGHKLELIFEDDKCDSKEGVNVANKLINIDKVPAIIGTLCSSPTLAVAPIAEQNKVLLLSSGASAPAIKDAGDYVFSIYPLDNYEVGLAAEFAYDKLNKRNAAILYANNDYGKGAKDVLEEKFIEKGGKINIIGAYLMGAKDFRTQLLKIKNSGVDVLFIWGQPNEMVPILTQKDELGLNVQIITSSVTIETDSFKKANVALANGVIYTSYETTSNANSEYLNKEYYERYQKDDSFFPAVGYDVVLLIADALKNVGTDATKMKNFLYSVKDFPGASGNMSFDKNGTIVKGFVLKTVRNGQFVPYEQ